MEVSDQNDGPNVLNVIHNDQGHHLHHQTKYLEWLK